MSQRQSLWSLAALCPVSQKAGRPATPNASSGYCSKGTHGAYKMCLKIIWSTLQFVSIKISLEIITENSAQICC